MQATPPVPQAVFAVPCLQVLPSQQPMQLAVVHTHVPLLLHSRPAVRQLAQTPPVVPQAVFAVPGLHWLFSQQPFGQLAVVHVHVPATHC